MKDKLTGKWLNIGARFHYYPDIIEFENGEIKRSLIKNSPNDLLIKETREKKFDEKISSLIKIENIDSDRIRIYRNIIHKELIVGVKSTTKEEIFENDYVRLIPTISNLSENRIQLLKFGLKWNDEKLIIEFNKILDKSYIQEINKRLNREGNKILLEKLDQTLLVSMIDDNKRRMILPIKDINDSRMILYGFPEKPYETTAKRLD